MPDHCRLFFTKSYRFGCKDIDLDKIEKDKGTDYLIRIVISSSFSCLILINSPR